MTIIVVPTERCNFKCTYCFEPQSVHDGVGLEYNFDAIQRSLLDVWSGPYRGSDVCLHGGEPLMTPIKELSKLMDLIYNLPWEGDKIKGTVSIVTNGSLVTDKHIDLFKYYNVYVGLSCDGPPELNIHRGPCPDCKGVTEEYNKELEETIRKLRRETIPVSIMCILHQGNAGTKEKRVKLGQWMLRLKKQGITGGRTNPMYSDTHPELELTNQQIHQMWVNVYNWNKKYGLNWNPLIEMEKNLTGQNKRPSPCVYNQCNPFNTHTLSILPDGSIGCCDRTFNHGIYMRSGDGVKCGRYEALRQTDCKGCKYWTVCGGACPEEGIGGDWRRKTRFCEAIYKTYAYIEKQLAKQGIPVKLEEQPEEQWTMNQSHGDKPHGDSGHGDSTHGDMAHGDIPHGDSAHGDNPDWRE